MGCSQSISSVNPAADQQGKTNENLIMMTTKKTNANNKINRDKLASTPTILDRAHTIDTTTSSSNETTFEEEDDEENVSSSLNSKQQQQQQHLVAHLEECSSNDGSKAEGETKTKSKCLSSMIKDLTNDGSLHETVVRIETPFGIPIEQIYDGCHDGIMLGSGVSGIVRKVRHKKTGVDYAVKILDLSFISSSNNNATTGGLKQLRDEIYIMCQIDHPNIVRLEEVYESENEIYLVMELCEGGDLFDRLDEQPDYHYTEVQCARLVKQMLSAVRYLHTKNIIHRDLKLENFLFSSSDPTQSELRMIDFGLSKHFQQNEQVHHETVGTPYTVAPEVIQGSYDERCDLWSIGVISFLLLSGEAPFGGCYEGEAQTEVKKRILSGSFAFEPKCVWENVSDKAKDFISKLLVVDKRPTAKELQKHPWLQDIMMNNTHKENGTSNNHLNPKVVESLVAFKGYSEMRKLLCEVLSFTLLPEQIRDLRNEFEILDTNGDGEISLSALKHVLMKNAEAQGSLLGALAENEVEDIFNALRLRKNFQTIRWHEFIAAGLSQCEYDDRNLRLAFDRLDSDNKGYITFENLMSLMGYSGDDDSSSDDTCCCQSNEAELRAIWTKSLHDCNRHDDVDDDRITYEDFLLLMKGQTTMDNQLLSSSTHRLRQRASLRSVAAHELELNNLQDTPIFPANEERTENIRYHMRSNSNEAKSNYQERPTMIENRSISMSGVMLRNKIKELEIDDEKVTKQQQQQQTTFVANNKQLYWAHREMRLSVLAASKRFEEKTARRAEEAGAGLIFKRGSNSNGVEEYESGPTVNNKEEKVNARCKRRRTCSDLTGMFQ